MREIAVLMGRSPPTISRELARGADASGRYRPFEGQRRTYARRRLHRPSRLAQDAQLREWVTAGLLSRWSPAQVSRGLRRRFPDQPERWLCAEAIYRAVYRLDLGGPPASCRDASWASGVAIASRADTRGPTLGPAHRHDPHP